jgi:hypothetical protein
VAVPVVSHFRADATLLSSVAVAATLAGGSLSWMAVRIFHQKRQRTLTAKRMANDISYFTPAALFFGFCVYDPAIYLLSHYLLVRAVGAWVAVMTGQLVAFSLFLLAMNLYRLFLFRLRGKAL